ncbi:uncharacterized protein LOC126821261 [Patella vulgata]|uniref:uncharacterized protein LOC126821261 n=1 Tax=Patella vulgata TaxID=6465 RepID=UPI0021809449|nr:uncharacterized protein LOC126821261 [Patella vulgata]XP_050405613.1 uncharacterized protein LOC126821261 [Patella vulgata]XP_050405615.1 uncharacterized protein LOC126821261 [Patella vulgata]
MDTPIDSPDSLYVEEGERIQQAYQEALKQGSLSPIIKEELRLSIMAKRHENYQDAINTSATEEKNYKLTEDEIRKKERRREQNRQAAERCRQKKKASFQTREEEKSILIRRNKELNSKVAELKKQMAELGEIYQAHIVNGNCFSDENKTVAKPHCENSYVSCVSINPNMDMTCTNFEGISPNSPNPSECETTNWSDVSSSVHIENHYVSTQNITQPNPYFVCDDFPESNIQYLDTGKHCDAILTNMYSYLNTDNTELSVHDGNEPGIPTVYTGDTSCNSDMSVVPLNNIVYCDVSNSSETVYTSQCSPELPLQVISDQELDPETSVDILSYLHQYLQ